MSNPETMSHHDAIKYALITLDVNPKYVTRRYVEAVFEEEDFDYVAAAKRLGMGDAFVLRRIMARPRPPVRLPGWKR